MPTFAFPGAEGFAQYATGGRGDGAGSGVVLHVTNLNEKGAGSHLAAVKYVGPAVVVYDVSGVINITDKPVTYTQPDKTFLFHTSPDGVCFAGQEHRVQNKNIVFRHGRFRTGDVVIPRDGYDNQDALNSGHPDDQTLPDPWTTYNVMFDHCSFSWSIDETLTFWYQSHDITVQKCIVAEGLMHSFHPKGYHSMGTLCGIAAHNINYHHNLLANCNQRMPQFAGDLDPTNRGSKSIIDFRCNTVFNWGEEPCAIEHLGNRINLINNFYKIGPDFNRVRKELVRLTNDATDAQIYIEGNIDPTNPTGTLNNWNSIRLDNGSVPTETGHRLFTPLTVPAVTTQDAATAYQITIQDCGATVPRRDSVDLRILAQVRRRCPPQGTHYYVDTVAQAGGWPIFDLTKAGPLDTNADGIPDYYCALHSLSPTATIATIFSDDGIYTWIERYGQYLAGDPGAT